LSSTKMFAGIDIVTYHRPIQSIHSSIDLIESDGNPSVTTESEPDAQAVAAGDRRLNRAIRPTLKTISEITGLAVTTVSRALKDGPELSSETRARVQAVASELGYRPDRAGVRLRTGRTFVIGLILDQNVAAAEFERRIIMGVSRVLYETSYHLVVMPQAYGADPMEPVSYFVETRAADGLIFTHTRPHDRRVRYLLDRDFPFITHGRTDFAEPHPFYDFDNERFTAEAVRRLRERGRKRIALIEPPRHLACHRHAMEGFTKAVAAFGIDSIVADRVHLDEAPANFRAAARQLATGPNPPDGIVCANETGCIALMAGLRDGGLVIGRDIDVVAKGTSELLDHSYPAIDSFFEDLTFAGEELARLLLRRIAGAPIAQLQSLGEPRLQRRT
jgi:LacI family transcriptional regulator